VGPAAAQTREIADPKLGRLTMDLAYGPHRRHKLDFYRANSATPTPVVFYFHGGSFRAGDKNEAIARYRRVILDCLQNGVSFASANYPYLPHGELDGLLRDCARAVQFVRHEAAGLNVDPRRIAAFGVSAGAGISLWLAARDDLADPRSPDPVRRQSSRLRAAALLSGQFTYDVRKWAPVVGPPPFYCAQWFKAEMSRLAHRCGGLDTDEARAVVREIDLIGLLTPDDAPLWIFARRPDAPATSYDHYVHHPRHATELARRCQELNLDHVLRVGVDQPEESSPRVQDAVAAFLLARLGVEPKRPTTER
jgi:hypothetical protein